MPFRLRVLLAFLVVVLVPVAVMGLGVRREIEARLQAQYEERVAALASVIEEDLEREAREVDRRLSGLAASLSADNRFRASVGGGADRGYLLDYAGGAMALSGLSMLQIHDPEGRILSSGHFRNAFDVVAPELPRALASLPTGTALTPVRTAEGGFLALVHVDSVRLGEGIYHLVGGRTVGDTFLARLTRDPELSVRLVHPEGRIEPAGSAGERAVARAVVLPYLPRAVPVGGGPPAGSDGGRSPDPGGNPGDRTAPSAEAPAEARFEISFDGATLRDIRRSTDLWFALVLAGATAVSLLLAGWLSGRVTRPLQELANRAGRVSLDRLDVSFSTRRRDEIGQLSRVLGEMTERLRAGARELQDAERRATLGELARQVNHDVRNGLAPIRNVLRHLDAVARDEPASLPGVYEERRRSLASSVAYLETLAGNYARLSSRAGTGSTDPVAVASQVVEGAAAGSAVSVRLETERGVSPVRCDPVTFRRIVENLVANAMEAFRDESTSGSVRVRIESTATPGRVRLVVEDDGRGMTEEERSRAFEDFFTTREEGTGLGLPVVRRLVGDLGGSVDLASEEGRGTRVTVELPTTGSSTTGSSTTRPSATPTPSPAPRARKAGAEPPTGDGSGTAAGSPSDRPDEEEEEEEVSA